MIAESLHSPPLDCVRFSVVPSSPLGRIAEGCAGDFVMLDRDIFSLQARHEILDAKVDECGSSAVAYRRVDWGRPIHRLQVHRIEISPTAVQVLDDEAPVALIGVAFAAKQTCSVE